MVLKTTFEIPIFLVKEICEQAVAFYYYKCGLCISRMKADEALKLKM